MVESLQKNIIKRKHGTGKAAIQILHCIDVEINDREFIVIVGPSGWWQINNAAAHGGGWLVKSPTATQ
jgi:predicted ABC-type transport system involved in lysophospholipase L1 biosynthesis ATPase subunit